MSTHPVPKAVEPPRPPADREIVVYSHSTLYYWWPVWAVGFVLFIMTIADTHRLAIVPVDSKAHEHAKIVYSDGDVAEDRTALVYPKDSKDKAEDPRIHIAANKNYGVLFATILILVIVVTNVPLRGMWSLVVILLLFLLSLIFILAGIWERIFEALGWLQIYINAGGYLSIALVLLILWLVAMFVFDRQVYMIFTPGQFRVCQQIGGGEQVFPTDGMTLERHRSDLFRHWIVGLGSGDMTVKTPRGDHFDMHNVLFVGRKVALIEDMMREKSVVAGQQ